jgi:eukaryotic-like serine/threonine-protein kinase
MVAAGDIWEGHELLKELDRGVIRTFLARQLGDTDRLVWLYLREGVTFERAPFVSELRRLQSISEQVPSIAPMLDGDVSRSVAWVTSPSYGDMTPMKQVTRKAELGLAALKMAIALGQDLVQCHKLGAVHGSLSPKRVLMKTDEGFLVTHFGLARLFQVSRKDAQREPRYTPPELLQGGRLTLRSDVYGLGTVLFELLCRRDLYAGHEQDALCTRTPVPDFPMTVPAMVREVVAKALASEPRDRFPNVEHLVAVLLTLADESVDLEGAPARHGPVVETARTEPPAPRAEQAEGRATPASRPRSPVAGSMSHRNAPATEDAAGSAGRVKPPAFDPSSTSTSGDPTLQPPGPSACESAAGADTPPAPRRENASNRQKRPSNPALAALVLGALMLGAAGTLFWRAHPAALAQCALHGVDVAVAQALTVVPRRAPSPASSAAAALPRPGCGETPLPVRREEVAQRDEETSRLGPHEPYCDEGYMCDDTASY